MQYYRLTTDQIIQKAIDGTLLPIYYPRLMRETKYEIKRFILDKLPPKHKLSRKLMQWILEHDSIHNKHGFPIVK
ncbi:MAG: hypothetical protein K9W44_08885 [Candidatus Lokiarchaeota archaeon]|nr:hypothetical protein [Candidatus Harpocratesius repetitus]